MRLKKEIAIIALTLSILIAGSLLHIVAGYSYLDSSGHKWGSDDAYISYRYAQNLTSGQGLVFNPGERVEGYSNLLYILIIAPIFVITNLIGAYIFSLALNLIFLIVAFFIFIRFVKNRYGDSAMLFAAILFVLTPPLWAAVASGLESTMVLLIQILLWIALERYLERENKRDIAFLIIFAAFSILARADGFVFPILICIYLAIRGKGRAALLCGVFTALILGAHILWRYEYYGYLLPNTYYAKVSGPLFSRFKSALIGLARLGLRDGLLLYLIIPLIMLIRLIRDLGKYRARIFAAIPTEIFLVGGWLFYWIYVGGDVYYERFLLILYPLGLSLFLRIFWPLNVKRSSKVVLTAAMISLQLIPLVKDARFRYSLSQYDFLINLGKFLGQKYPDKLLATTAAGKLPYFSGLKTIDMYGLADTIIAHKNVDVFTLPGHDKYDMEYVLSRKPDIIATFINPDLSIFYGFAHANYDSAGYSIRYIVNTSKWSTGQDIIDTENVSPDRLSRMIDQEYDFAVLERNDRP